MVIGLSGFLGLYIVSSLLRKQDVSKILCVNRSEDGEDRTMATLNRLGCSDLADTKRLQFLVKDITTLGFGC
jgi:thioester reductase-like protein